MVIRIRDFLRGGFFRNVLTVAGGTAGAQAVTLCFAPLVARIYGPEAMGVLGTFMAILGVVMPISALSYPIAIVLPKSDAVAGAIVKVGLVVAFLLASAMLFLILVFGEPFLKVSGLDLSFMMLLSVPLAMVFAAHQQIFAQILVRGGGFKLLARSSIWHSVMVNLLKLLTGFFAPFGSVLVLIAALGQGVYAVCLWFGVRVSWRDAIRWDSADISIRNVAWQHRDFPIYRSPQVAINALSQSLPVILLSSFFGPAAAGFYALGRSVLGMPSALLGKAVADVTYPRITEALRFGGNSQKLLLEATLMMAALGALPFVFVIFWGPELFSLVFGAEWVLAGEYSQWMSVWLYFSFLNSPSVVAITALGLQRLFLFYEVGGLIVRGLMVCVGYWWYQSDVMAVAVFSVSGGVMNCLLIFYTSVKCRKAAAL